MTENEQAQAELNKIAPKIVKEHEASVSTYRKGLEHAKKAGELLKKAKDLCDKAGKLWEPWLKATANITRQHAANYIRVFDNWAKVEAAEGIDTVRGALHLLRTRTGDKRAHKTLPLVKTAAVAAAQAEGIDLAKIEAFLARLNIVVKWEAEPAAAANPAA
jgi:hypothetical protein